MSFCILTFCNRGEYIYLSALTYSISLPRHGSKHVPYHISSMNGSVSRIQSNVKLTEISSA